MTHSDFDNENYNYIMSKLASKGLSNVEYLICRRLCIIISLYGGSHASDILHILVGVSVA